MAERFDKTGGVEVTGAYASLKIKDQKVVDRANRSRSRFPQSPAERERLEKLERGEPVIVDRVMLNGRDMPGLPLEFRKDHSLQRFVLFPDDTLVPISTLTTD